MVKRRGKEKSGAGRSKSKKDAARGNVASVFPTPLPDDLIEDIFTRLPPKSLAVSRCVSPSWNHLISSPAFARLYHEVKAAEAVSDPVRFVSIPVNPDSHRHTRVTASGEEGPKNSMCEGCPRVFCPTGMPCHGMVLTGKPCQGDFFVCNPSTGAVLRLPPRRPPWYFYSAGLGYDEVAGKHKAVLLEIVTGMPRRWNDFEIPTLRCCVFTVGDPLQRWCAPRGCGEETIIFNGLLVSPARYLDKDSHMMHPVFADGRLHWMLLARAGTGFYYRLQGILSFELSGEFFRRIPLPTFTSDSKCEFLHATLAELDGRLCLVRDLRSCIHPVLLFEVWMLHDIMSGSWSLDRRIDLTAHMCEELRWPWHFFWLCYVAGESAGQSGKILFTTTKQRAYMYDMDAKELRTVAMSGDEQQMHLRLVLYQENLGVDGMECGKGEIEFKFTTDE